MADNEKGKKPEAKQNPKSIAAFGRKVTKFVKDCRGEIKKIIWPSPKATFKNTGVVLVTIIVLGLFVFLLDTAFMNLLGLVMNVAA